MAKKNTNISTKSDWQREAKALGIEFQKDDSIFSLVERIAFRIHVMATRTVFTENSTTHVDLTESELKKEVRAQLEIDAKESKHLKTLDKMAKKKPAVKKTTAKKPATNKSVANNTTTKAPVAKKPSGISEEKLQKFSSLVVSRKLTSLQLQEFACSYFGCKAKVENQNGRQASVVLPTGEKLPKAGCFTVNA